MNKKSSNPDVKDIIQQYLKDALMMQLATVRDNKPWVCNVWFAADKDLNIYWFSAKTRRHSIEIADNPHVAAAICLPQSPNDSSSRALQIEGTAERLTKPTDVAVAMKHYVGRVFSLKQVKQLMALVDRPHSFYKLTPENYILFDTLNFPENSRQEFPIKK